MTSDKKEESKKMALVPAEIDRTRHRAVLDVWNECAMNYESLEMTWPKLVAAMVEADRAAGSAK